jgi:hypothetical protein
VTPLRRIAKSRTLERDCPDRVAAITPQRPPAVFRPLRPAAEHPQRDAASSSLRQPSDSSRGSRPIAFFRRQPSPPTPPHPSHTRRHCTAAEVQVNFVLQCPVRQQRVAHAEDDVTREAYAEFLPQLRLNVNLAKNPEAFRLQGRLHSSDRLGPFTAT